MAFSRRRTIRMTHHKNIYRQIDLTLALGKICHFLFDHDLDRMTLILKLDLDMVKMYLYTKNEVHSYKYTTKQTGTETEQAEINTYPNTRTATR